jgi:diguanylate cyclase (GGDEF)-like protein
MDDRLECLSIERQEAIIDSPQRKAGDARFASKRRRVITEAPPPAAAAVPRLPCEPWECDTAAHLCCSTLNLLWTPVAPPVLVSADDPTLTGLPTVAQVSGNINGLITEAGLMRRTLAVVTLDHDGFRLVREAYGRALADDVIQFAVARVRSVACADAVVAHDRNDGFIFVLTGLADAADSAAAVQQVLDAIAVPRYLGGEALRITASAGIAMFPKDGIDFDTLSRKAYTAMRESKAKCPGALRFHSGNVAAIAQRRLRMEMQLRRAIENRELTLHYQPQFELATGRACGVEVLARWFPSDDAPVEPSVFIPLAEQTQLIGALGSWVLQEACGTVRQWKTRGTEPPTLCVNVSPHQLDEGFAAVIKHALDRTGFPAEQLELEITESALITNADAIIDCFRQMKDIGVRIAIDDFGTGYSSLSYLSRLPVDRLKLDKSLIHHLTTQWKDVAILRSIIGLGRELRISVIAEGVETEQQFNVLKQLGCPQVQGYLLARPAPEKEAQRVLARPWGMRHGPPTMVKHESPGSVNAT